MDIILRAYQNRDFGLRQDLPKPMAFKDIDTFEDVRYILRKWIGEFNLGGGNVGTVPIKEKRKVIAYISYNGRIWTPEKDWQKRTEIKVGLHGL